ncbi:helix-turn-helix domain-containing protein [Aquimarina sp. 2201CG1-2-11]|uniref:helix-turn-helix domain-containing protein n=1 Tax=Aquimarina discodermiae TaxID=3231043 RepID=UPI0034626D93
MHKILKAIFFCKIILFCSFINAQTYIDSFQNKSFSELQNIYSRHKRTDSIIANQSAKTYLYKAKTERDTHKIVHGFNMLYDLKKDKTAYLDSIILIEKNKIQSNITAKAYFKKAQYFLYNKRDIKETLKYLNKARSTYIKEVDSIDVSYRIQYMNMIGIIKSEHLNEREEALVTFKKCEAFYEKQTEYIYKLRHLRVLHAIAETYISMQKPDSSSFYNTKGYTKSIRNTDNNLRRMGAYFILCEGINQHHKQNYKTAIDSINNALPTIIDFEDIPTIIDGYYYLGKSYFEHNQREKAIPYFIKTDSLLKTLDYAPEYKHIKTYEYLKNYYKEQDDLENQNKYLDKLNTVLDQYLNDKASIQKKVNQDYDIPLLLTEKEDLITKLNKNNTTYLLGILLLILSLIMCGALLYHQYRKRKLYRLRFEELISKPKVGDQPKLIIKNDDVQIPEKHVTDILEKLNEFEKNLDYLTSGLSSQSLANVLETNVKYLSYVINQYKNKNFTSYINELRVNYAIKELQENKRLRKYTIKAIAHELGYNSAETFSKAFYKQVKIKPSYYIKELIKKENTHS